MDYFDNRDDLELLTAKKVTQDDSPILEFYKGKNILITGGSGFFGKVLLEKLLRTCGGVNKIYLLMRPKRGKTPSERMKEQFNDLLFEKMKEQTPNYLSKVELVEGDMSEDRIGLSDADYDKLMREVHIIFHAAASLRMDEHLRYAYQTNVTATKFLLEMARKMPQLKSMIHFSTAYSHAHRKHFGERFYSTELTSEDIQQLFENLDDWQIGAITSKVVGKWLNTYGYTKALAENMVQTYREKYGLPVAVARPSIVVSTYKDPVRAWINNVYGATGVLAGAALGVLHTFYCDKYKRADLIPVDYVIHASIAMAWQIANQELKPGKDPVFNLVSTHYHKDLTWDKFMWFNENAHVQQRLEATVAVWPYSFRLENWRLKYEIECVQMHIIPAIIFDTMLRLAGKPPMLLRTFRKVISFVSFFYPYCQREWDYESNNVAELNSELTPYEREIFQFDIKKVDWNDFFWYYMRGLRLYVVKDDMSTLPEARIKSRRKKVLHKALLISIYAFRAYVVYLAVSFICSCIKSRFIVV
ncbi:unnamed protein product [Bemisia tabaci]|uniref:Fatty acyl-CoA reductase n=1 Tax=Bemisia tabaci TaxID=7038 RepID=A0A9P0A8T5_BEMTA|nr:unnamed protein product [Bemisia tabaci]